MALEWSIPTRPTTRPPVAGAAEARHPVRRRYLDGPWSGPMALEWSILTRPSGHLALCNRWPHPARRRYPNWPLVWVDGPGEVDLPMRTRGHSGQPSTVPSWQWRASSDLPHSLRAPGYLALVPQLMVLTRCAQRCWRKPPSTDGLACTSCPRDAAMSEGGACGFPWREPSCIAAAATGTRRGVVGCGGASVVFLLLSSRLAQPRVEYECSCAVHLGARWHRCHGASQMHDSGRSQQR